MIRPEDQEQEPPARRPTAPPAEVPPVDGSDIIGKVSGFNYTQKWGSRRGQQGNFSIGARPPSKADWDVMTPEERAAVGITDEGTFGQAHEAWQKRFQPGQDIWQERQRASEAIIGSGATDWEGIRKALLSIGMSEDPQEQGSFFKQLKMAMEGNSAEHGRYHWNGSNWVDVATSDMNKRGIPGMADYAGPRRSGMDAIRGELPQMHDIQRFQDWLGKSGTNANDLLKYQHGNMYGTGRYQYDQFGNLIDTTTGARAGHYYPGETREAQGGGGGNVDWGTPNAPAAMTGGGGGTPDFSSLPDWLKEMLKSMGVPIPGSPEDLAPKIIPSAIMPNPQQQLNPQNITPNGNASPTPPPQTLSQPQSYPPAPAPPPAQRPQPAQQPLQRPGAIQPSTVAGAWGGGGGNTAITGNMQPAASGIQRNAMTGEPQPGMQPKAPKSMAPRMPKTTPTMRPAGIAGY